MPILSAEPNLHPDDLLYREETGSEERKSWMATYTYSRREKEFMRRLLQMGVAFYCPIIPHRRRSPAGRIRTSYLPLFTNYVFVYGDADDRQLAYSTNCVARDLPVVEGTKLTGDLRQIQELIQLGEPITREERIEPGECVRIKSGTFRDFQGFVVRREGERRLLVSVNFLQQGASVLLEDCEVEPV